MKIVTIVILTFAIFLGQYTFAANTPKDYDPAEVRCLAHDDAVIGRLLERIDFADKAVPNIPPEEQRYLETESAAAGRMFEVENANSDKLHARSNQMYANLYARPLYAVWEFRKAIGPARSGLNRVLKRQPDAEKGDLDMNTYNRNPEAEKLERASRAVFAVVNYVRALQQFLDKIQGRELSMLTESQYSQFSSDIYSMNIELGGYISCKLAKIMGRQSFEF
jgi:hypothetical protein